MGILKPLRAMFFGEIQYPIKRKFHTCLLMMQHVLYVCLCGDKENIWTKKFFRLFDFIKLRKEKKKTHFKVAYVSLKLNDLIALKLNQMRVRKVLRIQRSAHTQTHTHTAPAFKSNHSTQACQRR